ncbi:MFS transporter [Archangium sp.]|uniref:MFS transporter n=1 Tax=Archangium sp. TaxID=1872627 RepID=UPI002D6E3FA2|nr:MFS transporter [Archangium sp.]HYO56039.1 MFS transporter [Archangium sp.]
MSPGRLRRSLRASVAEGVVAECVMACAGGAAITGWALYLGCGPFWVGLLGALPFLAQLMQLPGAWLTTRFGARRMALLTVALSRQAFLPLVVLPFLPVSPETKRGVLVAVAAAHHGLGILCNNAWVTWMGDLVPSRVRGRYFGRRTAISTLTGALATFTTGTLLDGARASERTGLALAALAFTACVLGALSTALMALKHDPARHPLPGTFRAARVLQPLRDAPARRLLAYGMAWNAALGLAGPFFTLYLLKDLKLGFTLVALQGSSTAIARMLAAPLWGRLIDRFGARPVLRACVLGLVLSPVLWVLAGPERWWPIALDALLGGVLLSGHGLAAFALPLAVAPARERPFYHAAFAMTGGASFALASAAAGALVQALPPSPLLLGYPCTALRLIFLLSALARGFAALLSRQLLEPAARALPPSASQSPHAALAPARAGYAQPRPQPGTIAPSVCPLPPPPAP